MKNVQYKDLLDLNAVVGNMQAKGLSVEGILDLIDCKEELQSISEKYRLALKDIMAEFDVQPDEQGTYTWADKESKDAISRKLDKLFSTEVAVESVNFLSKDDFVKVVEGLNINTISILKKYLVK